MKYAICQVSVAPMRAEDSDRSELVSQCLFGEKVEILTTKKTGSKSSPIMMDTKVGQMQSNFLN